MCVRISAHPSLALELAKYQTLLAILFTHYPAAACIRYDRFFWQAVGQDLSVRWDRVREDISNLVLYPPVTHHLAPSTTRAPRTAVLS